jgi:hypothetical protein
MTVARRHAIRAMIALGAVAASAALIACGGSEGSADDAEANAQDAALEFAECMREHGVDMPDPQPGEGGFLFQGGANGIDPSSERFQDASDACQSILDKAIPEGERPDPAEVRDKVHEMTECLRDKGYDVPEPQIATPGEGPTTHTETAPSQGEQDDLERLMDDPDFQQAQEDCSKQAGLEAPAMQERSGGSGGNGPEFGISPGG